MKARLLVHNENIVLLKCNGDIDRVQMIEARNFLLNFSDEKYCPELDTWFHDGFTIENYPGQTIAFVNSKRELVVKDQSRFRDIIISGETDFLSVTEYANLHGKSVAAVRRLCHIGRMPGAIKVGNYYLIPANTSYPID